jgi:hypothetical protein
MAIRITAIRLTGGQSHEHISRLWWTNPTDGKAGENTRSELVSWIEQEGGKAYVDDQRGNRANVLVVTPTFGQKYLRTYADGKWTDNLLALPRK